MTSSDTPGRGENMDADADGTSAVSQSVLIPPEGQLLRGITDLQSQLNAMSQRQDELMEFIGVLREHQGGPVPVPSAEGRDREPFVPRPGRLPSLEQPHNVPPNYSQPPPPLRDPVQHGGPVPGYPDCQQFPPFQAQDQVPGQPPFHRWGQNGQPMNPPPPQLPCPFPPLPHSVPTFDRLHDQMGQMVGFAHRNSVTLSMGRDMGPGARQFPPGWPYLMMHQSPIYFPIRPQVHPQTPFQMNPRVPPQMNLQMPSQMQMRGPMLVNQGAPPGPPPPYPGPDLAPGEPMPGMNRAGPSMNRRRAPRISRTLAASQRRSSRSDLDDGSKSDGTGLDVRPVSRQNATGGARTRTNPLRKARSTRNFYESD